MLNRKTEPGIKNAVDFTLKLPDYHHYTLKNGVPVYEINTGPQEVAQIEMVFYAGNWFEEKTAVAAATNALLKNGTISRTAFQLNEAFDYYGAFCSCSCHHETATIKLNSLSKDLPEILPVIAEMLSESIFPEDELAIFIKNNQQKLSVSLQKSDFVATRKIDEVLYGGAHPYGRFSTAADLAAINAEELKAFYKEYYLHGQCVIFVSGRFLQSQENLLNKNFGYLPLVAPTKIISSKHIEAATEKKYRIINDDNGVQGAIRISRPFISRDHPDFTKAMLLNTLFGGYFGSRLMSNIREDKGYTYGIHSYVQNHLHECAWMITTDAGKDVSEATITEVYKEMEMLRNELVSEEELSLVRNYMIGTILGGLDGPFQIMSKWKNIILNGMTGDYFYDTINAIKTTTAEELQAMSKTYLNPEDFYEVVVY